MRAVTLPQPVTDQREGNRRFSPEVALERFEGAVAYTERPPWVEFEVLTETEAAAYLRYHVHTLRRWRSRGEGPKFVKSSSGRSGRVTYRVDALRNWLASHEVESTWEDGNDR